MRKIINVLSGMAFIILIGACHRVTNDKEVTRTLGIIPKPVEVNMGQGFFTIRKNTVIYYESDALLSVARYLAADLKGPMGYELQIREGAGNGINLHMIGEEDESLGEEGYRLQVTTKNIDVAANKANGIFYGIQTLLQMLPAQIKSSNVQEGIEWLVPSAEIEDVPRFPWRGLIMQA